MQKSANYNSNYKALLVHVVLGAAIFAFPSLSKVYAIATLLYGGFWIIKNQNNHNEALWMAMYAIGMELLLRMTDGGLVNEYGKYAVITYLTIGMFFSGFSMLAFFYVAFIIFLIPGIYVANYTLSLNTDFKKAIVFNLSGPLCIGVAAVYCINRQITWQRLQQLLSAFCYPALAILVYLVLFNPSVKSSITGTESNFETSGGFGPNQVSTILGLSFFVFFIKAITSSNAKINQLIYFSLSFFAAYRCLVTFSRGGFITAIAMIFIAIVFFFILAKNNARWKIIMLSFFTIIAGITIWVYSLQQTNGLIEKRYSNQDARGRVKKTQLSGREALMESELQLFFENPITGSGIGKSKESRESRTGIEAASHNEITRMLSEHGLLGIINLLILLIIPLVKMPFNKRHILALSFYLFWLLTINHAAMRLAAPALIYALSILQIVPENEENNLHRDETT